MYVGKINSVKEGQVEWEEKMVKDKTMSNLPKIEKCTFREVREAGQAPVLLPTVRALIPVFIFRDPTH